MSERKQKKLRQLFRRDIKGQFKVIQSLIRGKPRFMPLWMWRKMVYRVLDLDMIENSNEKKKGVVDQTADSKK